LQRPAAKKGRPELFGRRCKKDAKKISEALSLVYSRIDTLEKKNILHTNTAARRKSRVAKMVKSFTAK
jgi:ribosomal protein S20